MSQGEFYAGRPVISARGFFGGGEAEMCCSWLTVCRSPMPRPGSLTGRRSLRHRSVASRRRAVLEPRCMAIRRSPACCRYFHEPIRRHSRECLAGSFGTAIADGNVRTSVQTDSSGGVRGHQTDERFCFSRGGARRHWQRVADGKTRSVVWRWNGGAEDRYRDDPGANLLQAVRADRIVSDPVYRFDDALRRRLDTSAHVSILEIAGRGHCARMPISRRDTAVRTILLAPNVPDRQQRMTQTTGVGGSAEAGASLGARGPALQFGSDLRRDNVGTVLSRQR